MALISNPNCQKFLEMTTLGASFVFQAHALPHPSPNWAGMWTNTSLCTYINDIFSVDPQAFQGVKYTKHMQKLLSYYTLTNAIHEKV